MGLVETSLEVVKLATKIANPELVQAATKANIEALEISGRNLELRKHAEELESKVKQLEAQLVLTGEVFREGDFVYREGESGACCSRCWDVDNRLVHIIWVEFGPGCPQCKIHAFHVVPNPHMK
ncbi:MAG: hypothetical protein ABSG23_11770 [Terriglobales bacterium]